MKTLKKKTYYPYFVSEQVFCMVHLAQTCNLKELRKKQDLIEQQIHSAHQHGLPTEDMLSMMDNITAAVAYQSFPDDLWMSFIRIPEQKI